MRIATFNVNSIRTRLPVVLDWLRQHRPDVFCLQETKTPDDHFPLEPLTQAGYRVLFRGRKGGNGVALLSLQTAEPVAADFDDGGAADPARLLAARIGKTLFVNTYVPQGRSIEHPMYSHKLEWLRRLRRWLEHHADAGQPVVWLGDMNVAPQPIDLHHPERHQNHVCFHPDVREAYARVVEWGFTDLYRQRHPESAGYSFYDYRTRDAIARGLGWRVDHILATRTLAERCLDCRVDLEPRLADRPSDHAVVVADLSGVQRT